jgi:D-alanyl-D-alanine carboxypeptidase (penicillin-binding protein 5/6)
MTFPKPKRKNLRFKIAAIVLTASSAFFVTHQPQHRAEAQQTSLPKPAYTATINWPENISAAAIGVQDGGIVASHNDTKPRPIASIAKLITALAVLEKHPLSDDDMGPSIPITEADEQLYRDYVAKNGTVVLVKAGVPLTERDALEGMLLPSANNIADTTAIWAFGSLKKYHDYANNMLSRLGLKDTTVGVDGSGLDPSTKSTASDLVRIGEAALKNPTIAHIVALPAAYIPYAGDIPNYNAMVTKYGYTGLKLGESIQAGNTLLFSTNQTINGKPTTVIGAILGSEGYKQSNAGAMQMVDSLVKTLKPNK